MLSGLRPGTPVYILYKNEPRFAVAKVVQTSNLYPAQFNFNPLVDLVLDIDGKTESFAKIPPNSSVAEFPDKGIILSETRDGVINEVNAMRNVSAIALEQIGAHKHIVEVCDQLLLDLNPQLKREQAQAAEIDSLKQQLAGMSDQIAALTGMLSKSLGKKTKEE